MSIEHFLILALLIAACIPVLDVVVTWFYWRDTHFGLHMPSFGHRAHDEASSASAESHKS